MIEQLENFVSAGQQAQEAVDMLTTPETLHCAICTRAIPEARAMRQTATCSEKCKDRLDTIRANQRRNRKCTHCLHPSTPHERALFRKWREANGDLKVADSAPRDRSLASKQLLREGLQSALHHLRLQADRLASQIASEALQTDLKAYYGGYETRAEAQKALETLRARVHYFESVVDKQASSNKLTA